MKCSKCQAENLDTEEFCHQCGEKLEKVCPKCGTGNISQYSFCGECGYDLALAQWTVPQVEVKDKVCPNCGAGNVPQYRFCGECGYDLSLAQETTPRLEMEKKVVARVPSGIGGLDPLIGGGFLNGNVYLISGEAGSGKTIFGLQYLFNGLIQGENGIYISVDEKPDHPVVDAESLGWDFGKYVEEQKLGLMDASPYFADVRVGRANDIDVRAVVADLASYVEHIGAKRIVFDPIAPIVFGEESLARVQEYIRKIILAIQDSLQCTVLVTSSILPETVALSRYGIEEFITDGVIVLGIGRREGQRTRTLFIRKMRGTATDLNVHAFEILPSEGIVILD